MVAQLVKSLSAMQETWVQSVGQEDPLEKEMKTHDTHFKIGLQGVSQTVEQE